MRCRHSHYRSAHERLRATPSAETRKKSMAPSWLLYAAAALLIIMVTTRIRRHLRKRKVVAFLHPYAAQGGGVQRAVGRLQRLRKRGPT